MVYEKEEGYNVSELGNWNVAADFSKLKIMRPLALSDSYENIARFGYDTLLESLESLNVPTDTLKLMAFERLINELLKLCSNARFAMKIAGTKVKLDELRDQLLKIRGFIPKVSKTIKRLNSQSVAIIPDLYYPLLDKVLEIKSELNYPLNKNNLIFTDKEEFDPKAYKKKVMEDAKNIG